jgi:hypothetical protein
VHSKSYNLAKNDAHLKMTRLIFRYRNNLDDLFELKPEPQFGPQPPALLGLSQHSQGRAATDNNPTGRRKSLSNSSGGGGGR